MDDLNILFKKTLQMIDMIKRRETSMYFHDMSELNSGPRDSKSEWGEL